MLLGSILVGFVLALGLTLLLCDRLMNGKALKEVKRLKKELGYE
jgi:hypothetical protein